MRDVRNISFDPTIPPSNDSTEIGLAYFPAPKGSGLGVSSDEGGRIGSKKLG